MSKRLLISGSRDWSDFRRMYQALHNAYDMLGGGRPILVHGNARGADLMAEMIWTGRGLPTEAHPANWKEHGKAAGPRRNQLMVDLGADLLLAFPLKESIGTRHCIKIAEVAGIPTVVIEG